MLRITADTNIFISGLNFKGEPFKLLTLARAGVVEIATSERILAELRWVLHGKFKWPDEDLAAIEKEIRRFTPLGQPEQAVDVAKLDPTDKSNTGMRCDGAVSVHRERRQPPAGP